MLDASQLNACRKAVRWMKTDEGKRAAQATDSRYVRASRLARIAELHAQYCKAEQDHHRFEADPNRARAKADPNRLRVKDDQNRARLDVARRQLAWAVDEAKAAGDL